MLAKGCIVSEAEQHKKSMLYRLRTAPNASLASNPTLTVGPANTDQEPQYVVPLGILYVCVWKVNYFGDVCSEEQVLSIRF